MHSGALVVLCSLVELVNVANLYTHVDRGNVADLSTHVECGNVADRSALE